jgi:hypothetical protein
MPALVLSSLGLVAGSSGAAGATPVSSSTPSSTCEIAGPTGDVQHVVQITFDNVHFNRDNPNVLSDMEQIPALTNFIEDNGTLLSNNHTPLIAHTADDTITNYTGLYGDRQGNGISNDYYTYTNNNPGGATSAQQSSFSYWNAPGSVDSFPNMDYSATVPASDPTDATPPAPWVPFTRAGCNVGDFSTANMELENQTPDIANVFGANSPEEAQLRADTSEHQDQEQNDYLGVAVHCASSDPLCTTAQAVKYGQTTPAYDAVPDNLPSEPGGYTGTSPVGSTTPGSGYLALFGAKYIAPVIGAGAADATTAECPGPGTYHYAGGQCFQVTDAAGNLVDLNGQEIDGEYSDAPGPGFPGFDPTPAQSLAYVADMQESGIPVTYAYISDVHEVKGYDTATCSPGSYYKGSAVGNADGPGDPCYYQTTAAYNAAFTSFFARLAADGITPANTLFIFGADEGDHFSGANANRAEQPSCTGTPLTTSYVCTYADNQVGEVDTDIHGLLKAEDNDTTPFTSQPQGEAVYVTGNQPTSTVRQLERDFSNVTVFDPFDNSTETAAKWMVDATGEELLHFGNADPSRVPTFTVFPKPDVYFTSGTSDSCSSGVTAANAPTKCAYVNNEYAWNHGYYAPEIDNTWLGLVGPGVKNLGLDGSGPGGGPNSDGNANSGSATVSSIGNNGTWVDQSDIRPTLMALTGLKDDYTEDGRVISEVIDPADLPSAVTDPEFQPLAVCYKQLNSSVGQFGSDVIEASTTALETGSSANDSTYQTFESSLSTLGASRDALATKIKNELWAAEFDDTPLGSGGTTDLASCQSLLAAADNLVSPPASTPEAPSVALLPVSALLLLAAGALTIIRRRRLSA